MNMLLPLQQALVDMVINPRIHWKHHHAILVALAVDFLEVHQIPSRRWTNVVLPELQRLGAQHPQGKTECFPVCPAPPRHAPVVVHAVVPDQGKF